MQGFGTGAAPGGDFNDSVRQAWTAWGNLMRGAGMTPPPAAPAWSDPAAWWVQMAGAPAPAPEQPGDALLRGLRDQAGGWFAQMQRLAAQFAGRDASAKDIAAAWKQMLGGHAAQSFTDVFASMSRPGGQGMEQWLAQVQPFLQMLQVTQGAQPQADARSMMGLPTFGFAREHQARWQKLALAQIDHQDSSRAFAELMNEAAQQAFSAFERKLAERSQAGQQLESTRALFDLWVDAAEESYAEIALSPRFREAYGALVDSQMRLRAAVQREIELMGEMLGTPTRTEVDAAHRKIVQLERELRRLRDAVEGLRANASAGGVDDQPRAAQPKAGAEKSTAAQPDAPSKSKPVAKSASKADASAGKSSTGGKASASAKADDKRKPTKGASNTKKAR
ncbi:class III poly(R)-hydroxyalkanoic acid synthase subunit PhaE [Cognatilysobacter bugurensis]|uniref:Poly(3-hydroxyalkanoate) polymerase subunit PhaE n=1 Tax=Cognatilysobacter bugurensis TaxID=543356 RepID=A0A918SVQ2_9GAMM|nr:class III poly(R)-hydroxyalkanoic acid synthase subunit PhaE [Lysobacter bugurensis]GHA71274.1 class III poly(R)-hydroxyalkanoic acid synthase subunit PhaE [Lysobacter bugurensis]